MSEGSGVPQTYGPIVAYWHGTGQRRADDVRLIIDRVGRQATAELSLKPQRWVPDASEGLAAGFSYIGDLSLAVGTRPDISPLLWMRWTRKYADLELVEARLTKKGHAVQKRDGALWLPLDVVPGTGSATYQINSLAKQVVSTYKTAVDWQPA